jgi:beta-galactosidase/beta-glucuronidase
MKKYFFLLVVFLCLNQEAFGQVLRSKYPQPQFKVSDWRTLNGKWDFVLDLGESGEARKLYKKFSTYNKKILVPFPPESKLSGIGHKDFMPSIWYHRKFTVPDSWNGKRIFIHFGAVDYKSTVWINGMEVGKHDGGSTPFSFEITDFLKKGQNDIVLHAEDHIRNENQPGGKQSATYYNDGCCMYTRVTGIWQSVWLDARPQSYIESVKVTPDVDHNRFILVPEFKNFTKGQRFKALLKDQNGEIIATGTTETNGAPVVLNVKHPKLWGPGHPYLYKLNYELIKGGKIIEQVKSYAGLRKIEVIGNKIYLNNKPIFLRFALIQGFYPNGVWTARSDEMLKSDIKRAKRVGLNGARLHEKVFDPRFLYWADKLGFLVSEEFPDWVMSRSYNNAMYLLNLKREWHEEIKRDYNHPAIVKWTPVNEPRVSSDGEYEAYRRFAEDLYHLTKELDPTRPVENASGYLHVDTDLWSVHDYTMDADQLKKHFRNIHPGMNYVEPYLRQWSNWYTKIKYEGQPFLVSEYGGVTWLPSYTDLTSRNGNRFAWGYGKSANQMVKLIREQTKALLNNPNISGFCFTQLYDTEQEVNGLYTSHRKLKYNAEKLKKIFGAPAAIERTNNNHQ